MMTNVLGVAFLLRCDLEQMLERKIQFCVLTDSQGLFNASVKSTTTTERGLMTDVPAAPEVIERG